MRQFCLTAALGIYLMPMAGVHPLYAAVRPDQQEENTDEDEMAPSPEDAQAETEKDSMLRAARQVHLGQIRFMKLRSILAGSKRGRTQPPVHFQERRQGAVESERSPRIMRLHCGRNRCRQGNTGPQESGAIDVTFDTTDFNGPVVKTITVMTNERHVPDRTLSIKATVVSEFEVNPPLADFGSVPFARRWQPAGFHQAPAGTKVRHRQGQVKC
jgi:hypothetical protein